MHYKFCAAAFLVTTEALAQNVEPPDDALSNARLMDMLREQQYRLDRQQEDIEELKKELFLETSDVFEQINTDENTSSPQQEPQFGQIPAARQTGNEEGFGFSSTVVRQPSLSWSGYGVLSYKQYDFFINTQDDDPDRRKLADVERFILEPTYDFANGILLNAEIEFEHGGTGSAVEYEPEEFGEYEMEVEKGGEVVLEQLNLLFLNKPSMNWRVGHFLVPFGMVNSWHRPEDYFTVDRSLTESSLFPVAWHASGVEMLGVIGGKLRYQLQLINGLDSSGFSGHSFVANGQDNQLEYAPADSLATLLRLDYNFTETGTFGGAVYYGNSASNRYKQNLDTDAYVTLLETHIRYSRGPFSLRSQYVWGNIQNSDKVTRANLNTFNAGVLGISRTPVAKSADGFFVEAGYNLLKAENPRTLLPEPRRIDLFARYDKFDTMAETSGDVQDQPRYDITAVTAGVNYRHRPGIVFKAEFSKRRNEGSIGNESDQLALSVGFDF
ncbi:MAG: autotransporter outer membrane beta-barrel domain-containing protein [Gammaproteobacteria bacterium]|nr:autotransporter outer membrane beta-barrel domain-containing protein [Gammaproteobacteria bacterium]